jgi:hypothetical protein
VDRAELNPNQLLQLGLYERALEAQADLAELPDEYGRPA